MLRRSLVAVLLAGSVLGADVAAADPVATTAIDVTSKRTVMSAPLAPAVGTGFTTGGELFDRTGATKVGDGYSHCGVMAVTAAVPPSVTAHCTTILVLRDGQVHLSGMRTYRTLALGFDDADVAVVGGTGAYAGGRGEGRVTRATPVGIGAVGYRFTLAVTTG